MAKASRGGLSGCGRNHTETGPDRARKPCWRRALKVAWSPNPPIRPTAVLGPSGGEIARWLDRRESTCACESRGASSGAVRSVGMCVSNSASSAPASTVALTGNPGWCSVRRPTRLQAAASERGGSWGSVGLIGWERQPPGPRQVMEGGCYRAQVAWASGLPRFLGHSSCDVSPSDNRVVHRCGPPWGCRGQRKG